jgi:hypothetical protein
VLATPIEVMEAVRNDTAPGGQTFMTLGDGKSDTVNIESEGKQEIRRVF